MAKDNSRYIQFYTPGTAAVKVVIQEEQNWAPLPAPKPQKKMTVAVDPVAIFGFLLAVCMLVLMAIGIQELNLARREVATLEHYVAELTVANQTLEQNYRDGYNADEIRQKALDMGMISVEEAPESHIYVTLPQRKIQQPQSFWEKTTAYLTGLFA